MTIHFRWFGESDPIPLTHVRQIPGIRGVVAALGDIPVGEAWPQDRIQHLRRGIEAAGLKLEVIESVNVHEDIKLGNPSRDGLIENYKITLRRLAEAGVQVVCYNFMPVFDWFRTDLAHPLADGSNALYYDASVMADLTPAALVRKVADQSRGLAMPGWEPERLAALDSLMQSYQGVDAEALFANLRYFLEAVIPVCEQVGIKMALHPDDPPWPLFGLPRIVTHQANLDRILDLVDSPAHGLTLCSGSLGANPANDIPALVRRYGSRGRIHFAHVRNILRFPDGSFHETSHLSSDGSLDLYEILKAYHDVGYRGPVRPDHGRMIWGETGRPGYGLYDRALGIAYLNGLWEALEKE